MSLQLLVSLSPVGCTKTDLLGAGRGAGRRAGGRRKRDRANLASEARPAARVRCLIQSLGTRLNKFFILAVTKQKNKSNWRRASRSWRSAFLVPVPTRALHFNRKI